MSQQIKRTVFVSYHHGGDQTYYDAFSKWFHDVYQMITDSSLERKVNSSDEAYIMRRISDAYLHGSSCTIVLCGAQTPQRKYVDWEISASLNQKMALVGILLPTIFTGANGGTTKPPRLQDNIDSGYAEWIMWSELVTNPALLAQKIEASLLKSKTLLVNTRQKMIKNG